MVQQVGEASIPVYYERNGQKYKKDVKFKGNFGFQINDRKYTVKNGQVYNQYNQKLKCISKDAAVAYQFIGMSNTAESAKDYTFSIKDIQQAAADQKSNIKGQADKRTRTTIGTEVCTSIDGKTTCDGTKFTTQCKDNVTGRVNTVSIWTLK